MLGIILLGAIQFILGKKQLDKEWGYLIPICFFILRTAITVDFQYNLKISLITGLLISFFLKKIFDWGKSNENTSGKDV